MVVGTVSPVLVGIAVVVVVVVVVGVVVVNNNTQACACTPARNQLRTPVGSSTLFLAARRRRFFGELWIAMTLIQRMNE